MIASFGVIGQNFGPLYSNQKQTKKTLSLNSLFLFKSREPCVILLVNLRLLLLLGYAPCTTFYYCDHMSLVMRKPVFGVFDQVRLKPVCSATEAG